MFRRVAPALPTPAHDLRERPVEVDGYRGKLIEMGEGRPLMLLATTLVRSRPYAPVIRRLARRFRVYAVDMPGCGGSQRLAKPWGFERYARWAAGLLEQLGLEQVTLVGHSNSAGAAMVLGTLHPERLSRIVLADTVGADTSPSYSRVLLGRALDAFLEPWLSVTGWHHLVYNLLFHTRNFLGQIKASITQDLRPYARRINVPTLIAWGARDHTMPLRCAYELEKILPRPTLHVSPAASHDWIITNPDEFAEAVVAFADATQVPVGRLSTRRPLP